MLDISESSSNSEDMDAAAAEAMLDVGDLEYEDEDTSSDDEEGVRRYLRANGMGRRLEHPMNYKCSPRCMNKFKKCRVKCTVYRNGDTRCLGGHLPGKCKNNCCRLKSSNGGGGDVAGGGGRYLRASRTGIGARRPNPYGHHNSDGPPRTKSNGQLGTSPYLPTAPGGPLPYCPNGSWHVSGMTACIASQVPMPPGFPVCPSGTVGFSGGVQCVVW